MDYTQDVSGMPIDDSMMQLEMKRRLARAEALRNQAGPQGQMVGNQFVAPSWTQYLANAVNKIQGAQEERQAMKQYGEYTKTKAQKQAEALKSLSDALEPKQVEQYADYNESGNMPLVETKTQQPTAANLTQALLQYGQDTNQPEVAQKAVMNRIAEVGKRAEPMKLGKDESIGTWENGAFVPSYTNVSEKPEAVSPLARLQNERRKLIETNPNDPRIKEINAAITKETTFAPPAKMEVNMPKVETSARINSNEDFTKNVYRPTLDAAARNSAVISRLDALDKLPISEQTGWGTQAKASAYNVLVGMGYKSDEAKSLASNAQTFRAIQARQVNDELNAAKGPQTEGDSVRAAQTVASLGNSPDANKFINSLQRAIIKRKNAEAKFYRDHYTSALAAGDLSQLERDWMDSSEAAKSIFEYPEMKAWEKVVGAPASSAQDYHSKYGLTPRKR